MQHRTSRDHRDDAARPWNAGEKALLYISVVLATLTVCWIVYMLLVSPLTVSG